MKITTGVHLVGVTSQSDRGVFHHSTPVKCLVHRLIWLTEREKTEPLHICWLAFTANFKRKIPARLATQFAARLAKNGQNLQIFLQCFTYSLPVAVGQDPHGRGDIPKAVDQFVGFEQGHRCAAGTEARCGRT